MESTSGWTLSLEDFKEYVERTKQAGLGDHADVYIFHAHNYADESDPSQLQALEKWYADLKARYSEDPRVEFGRLHPAAAGPHPVANFEMAFTRGMFTEAITYMQFNRPEMISIMVHPFTTEGFKDHTSRPIWLGKQLPVKAEMLKGMDKRFAQEVAGGADAADVLWAFNTKINSFNNPRLAKGLADRMAAGEDPTDIMMGPLKIIS